MAENIKYVLIILLLAIIWSPNALAQVDDTDYRIVDPNAIPDVLSMLASVTQINFEKIKTWQGRITNKNIITIRGEQSAELLKEYTDAEPNDSLNEIQGISDMTIEFKIDVENNRFFSLLECTEPPVYLDPQKDKSYPSLRWVPVEQIQIVTSEHQVKISPYNWGEKEPILKRIAIKELPRPNFRTDPRGAFYIGEKTLWIGLLQLDQALQILGIEKSRAVIKKKSVGDDTAYRIEVYEAGKDILLSIIILSSEAGFNRTFFENWYRDGSLMSKVTTEFVNLQGVFLPRKWEMEVYYPDGGLMRQEDCTIEHQQINKSIPDSTFSVQNHLREGDVFRDKIANKEFEYKDGELVEIPQKPKD
jgi:hypothetical protein